MTETHVNPVDKILRAERMPHIWCPGCGIGISVNCFANAIDKAKLDFEKLHIVSGIGCTGRVAGYVNIDSFHTTHGRAIPFATGLSMTRPNSKVVVYSGDGDLTAIGGNHLIHAARRNADLTVICVNNFIYGMTGGQIAPTSPLATKASTTPYGSSEQPFNLANLVDACGAVFVARWTTYHVHQLTRTITKALNTKGFSFVEIIAPCPTLHLRRNKLGDGLKMMQLFKEKSVIKNGIPTSEATIDLKGEIVVGEFVERERPTFWQGFYEQQKAMLGDAFVPYMGAK